MKRTVSLILSAIILMGILLIPPKAHAATLHSKAGIVSTSGSKLNVRKSSSTGSAVVTTLQKGTYVTLISRSGSWWYVEYGKNKYGYCHADYISPVPGSAATVSTSSGPLNVRSGAGTSYSRIGSLARGETVIVLSTSGGWSRILYHGTRTGYASAQYLSSQSSGSDSAVSLNVPNFKQTDGRWAHVKIGTSGKNMAQIGCATTALAMMESHRTGTTIYPDAMSKKLTYTPSGNVYWPDNYAVVTSNSGYLQAIYEQLKLGKPVLFGAKNPYGSQHWVVITGFNGGTLTASGFTINDPGSNSRTNLQQLLNSYPTFYKYFYYN